MKTVIFRSPAITMSGYGQHARMICQWLLQKEAEGKCNVFFQLLNWGETPWILDRNRMDGLVGKIIDHSSPPQGQCDVSIQLQLPNEWDVSLAKFNIGVTAGVETDKCNPEWIKKCNLMNLIVVPSEHTKRTLLESGNVTTQIKVIPESFPDNFLLPAKDSLELNLETKFNFLLFGQLTGNNPENDRKNIFYTLKWLCETFKSNPDVGIVVKTNSGRNTKIDRNVVKNTFERILFEARKGAVGPPVYLLHGDLNDDEIFSLLKHQSIKAMVNLTRGEGFGLPILEAAAADLPVIATNWSAHTEFLNQGKWVQVDYSMVPIRQSRVDNQIFIAGTRWANPSQESFKKRVKKFYESPSIPQEWAKELGKSVRETHSFSSISSKYDSELGGLFI